MRIHVSKHCFRMRYGNKAVRMLTSAKGLIPLQSKKAQYAKEFRLDKKTKEEDQPRSFEDHVKSVEELVAFHSNHEQEALERTGKRNTNGTDMTIPRCTRQSFLVALESLTSLTNTLTEIGHSHSLDRICFESMTTLGVESVLFQIKGMRADRDMPTVAKYANRTARWVEDDMLRIYYLSEGFLIFHWAQFILSGENYQRWTPKHEDATKQVVSNHWRNR